MAADKRLDGMQNNPRKGWTIAGVEALCRSYDIAYAPPHKSSHAKVSDLSQKMILTVPFARPIKPISIKKLVEFVDAVMAVRTEREESAHRLLGIAAALRESSQGSDKK